MPEISLPIKDENFCVKLLRKSKKNFYNLNVNRVTDNRKFWQTIKSNCTDKTLKDERITLVEGEKVITEEKDVKIFKDHFEKIVETLKIDRPLSDLIDDPTLNAAENFSHHASVLKIKEARNSSDCFSFKLVTIEDICKEIRALDASKATQSDDIPTKIIKNDFDIFLDFFKRCINKQLKEYFQALLSKYQCGFRKGYRVINALLPVIEKWRKSLDAGSAFEALLICPKPLIVYLMNC